MVSALSALPQGGLEAVVSGTRLRVPRVLPATGGLDVEPELPGVRDAVRCGLIRCCPICDAVEVIGQKVALIAFGPCRAKEALLIRSYTADLTVLTLRQAMEMPDDEWKALHEAGIAIDETPVEALSVEGDRIVAWHRRDGTGRRYDPIYSALGTRIRSARALELGADADGTLLVDRRQRTSVNGLCAAGDVVSGLSQVSVASGHAATAATHINRSLPFPSLDPQPGAAA